MEAEDVEAEEEDIGPLGEEDDDLGNGGSWCVIMLLCVCVCVCVYFSCKNGKIWMDIDLHGHFVEKLW